MDTPAAVQFGALDTDAARALIRNHHLGRIAFSWNNRVEIEPISYVSDHEWIYMRTSHGTKTNRIGHHQWVAFQVDDITNHHEWRSVVVHGSVRELSPDGVPAQLHDYEAAVRAIRAADPDAFGPRDPAPHRNVILRLHIDDIVGKYATTAVAGSK